MRLAIVAEIHGNPCPLDAGIEPEQVVHGGHLAVNGPCPAELVHRIPELGWPGILDNTAL
jgi:hypothetical protein